MTSRIRLLGIVILQISAGSIIIVEGIYGEYQFLMSSMSQPSFSKYLVESLKEVSWLQALTGLVFLGLIYAPPTLAAFKWSSWLKFQNISLAIALVLVIVSLLSWEGDLINGCAGCTGWFLQLLFDFFILIAMAYRSVFYSDFE